MSIMAILGGSSTIFDQKIWIWNSKSEYKKFY